jgi:hypothetical protein
VTLARSAALRFPLAPDARVDDARTAAPAQVGRGR